MSADSSMALTGASSGRGPSRKAGAAPGPVAGSQAGSKLEPLGETDLNAVGIAYQVGGLHPQRYRRVEEAGSVDMDVEPPVVGPCRALGDLPRRRGVPSPPVVGVL